ncbi:MAG: polymorphic toxin-type HINT domain-containing protein, partial [Patescibacteria group bacterium]
MKHIFVRKKYAGFTLLELLVVVAIIGFLSSVSIVALTASQKSSRDKQRKIDQLTIIKAAELYTTDFGAPPVQFCAGSGSCEPVSSNTDLFHSGRRDFKRAFFTSAMAAIPVLDDDPGGTPGGGGGSFTGDTVVLTPDGARAIGSLQVGDEVMGYDAMSGKAVTARVSQKRSRISDDYLLINGSLRVTDEHPLARASNKSYEWTKAKDIQIGDALVLRGGTTALVTSVVRVYERGGIEVFNPQIDTTSNYFVSLGNSFLLVHNKGGSTGGSVCGDGTRDITEDCDDGNTLNCDLCNSYCEWGSGTDCGDGNTLCTEECDDGAGNGACPATCSSQCSINNCNQGGGGSSCGNGTCDAGENINTCPADCVAGGATPASCGNGTCDAGENPGNCGQDCQDLSMCYIGGQWNLCCLFGGE